MTAKRDKRSLVHQRCVERIKRLRAMRNLSQAEAALHLGWSAASYSDIESYNKKLELDKLDALATFYNVTISFLVDGSEDKLSKEMREKIRDSVFWL